MTRTIEPIASGFEQTVGQLFGAPDLPQSRGSVLRYPGGKTRAVQTIRSYIPEDVKTLVAPFLGGASVEISCAADGIEVFGADAFEPVVNFWQHARESPVLLSERVRVYHPLTRSKFYNLQKGFMNLQDDLERAAVFFVLNRSSFSGTTLSGGMSPNHPRFNESAINRLRDFRADNLHVSCADYKETIRNHPDDFLYLDPPYANGEKLYGNKGDMHKGFNHEALASELTGRGGWVLSYNDHPEIRNLYDGFDIIEPEWIYGMSKNKKSREVLIVNL